MLKSCRWCGRLHPVNYNCPKQPAPTKPDGEQRKLRATSAWTRKSLEIRRRDNYLCQWCLANGRINSAELSVHHIIPIAKDTTQAFQDQNLITLCDKCHEKAENGTIEREKLQKLVLKQSPPTP